MEMGARNCDISNGSPLGSSSEWKLEARKGRRGRKAAPCRRLERSSRNFDGRPSPVVARLSVTRDAPRRRGGRYRCGLLAGISENGNSEEEDAPTPRKNRNSPKKNVGDKETIYSKRSKWKALVGYLPVGKKRVGSQSPGANLSAHERKSSS